MKNFEVTGAHSGEQSFDLFRLSKAKETVDICANTLRKFHGRGLPFYRNGKAVFVSKRDLEYFIRASALEPAGSREVVK